MDNITTSSAFLVMDYISEKDLINKKACEYRRKSTDDPEKQLFSLEDQDAVNKKTIDKYELSISQKDVFEESFSAKKRGRPLFNQMVSLIEEGKYEVIVCWALNRLARNSVDGAVLIELMDENKLFAIVTYGKIYFNTPADKLLLSIEFGLSKKYSDDLSPAVKRGMVSKVKRGWWPGRPKIGYLNIKTDGEETKQIVDKERFDLLRDAIDLILVRKCTVLEALDVLNKEWGFRTRKTKNMGGVQLSKSRFYEILTDTYYYGHMVWGEEEGEVHPSLPRLFTEDEYWLIQDLLGSKGRPKPQKHTDLPYRGMIKCGECGSTWVPYKMEKKLVSGESTYYHYIRCNCDKTRKSCSQKQLSIPKLEKQIVNLLKFITISEDFCNWAIKWIKEEHQNESDKQQQILDNLKNALDDNQTKLNRLVDLHLNGLSLQEYNKKRDELEAERRNVERELKSLENRTYDWMDQAVNTFNFAHNVVCRFENGTAEDKTLILRTLGSNFYIKDGFIDIDLQKPFLKFKEEYLVSQAHLETIEPNDLVAVGANNKVFEDWFFKWSG